MKIGAFTALHYGLDYLAYAIRSVAPFVDEWAVAYSFQGSHGHRVNVTCPEDEEDLRELATEILRAVNPSCRLIWHSSTWPHEGAQRDAARTLLRNCDLYLVVDADEVYSDGAAEEAIRRATAHEGGSFRLPFIHFWRSFDYACTDDAWPVRVIKQGQEPTGHYLDTPPVLHFGYAREPNAISYKMLVHGHKGEWRPYWFERTFLSWTPDGPHDDLHPTNKDFWRAEPFDKSTMPDFMRAHPYYNQAVIANGVADRNTHEYTRND
jgi:hypothetical protein